jgi:hypothetical protein
MFDMDKIPLPSIDVSRVGGMLTNFNIDYSNKDWIIMLAFVVGIILHFLFLRRDKMFSILFSIYFSYLIILFFPYKLWLSGVSESLLLWLQLGGFVLLIFISSFIFSHAKLFNIPRKNIFKRFIDSIIFGILNVGLILSLAKTILPSSYLGFFSPVIYNLFGTELAGFIWLMTPIIIFIFFFKQKRKGPGRPSLD